jgi:hypothetical protein
MDYAPVTVHENYIDHETHGNRMDGLRWNNEQARTGFESPFAHQPHQPAQARTGDPNLLAKHGIPGCIQNCDRLRFHTTFSEESSACPKPYVSAW